MELIDKDALVAEIDKEIKCIYAGREYVGIPLDEENRVYGLQIAKGIINTLEVKEVDTEQLDKLLNWWKEVTSDYSAYKVKEVEDKPVSEDLGEYINELSKQFPEVSFAKLSRIAVRVSRWQQNLDVKNKLPKVTNRTDLDEYAYQCAYDMSNDWMIDNPTWNDVENACKLGANWQKQKTKEN